MSDKSFDDDFWDLDRLLPQRKPAPAAPVTQDVRAEEISLSQRETPAEPPALYGGVSHAIPPSGAARPRLRTPGDVRPPMGEPVCDYTPQESLIQSVSIWRWPSRYRYFDRFCSDAERFFTRGGTDAPYVPFYAYMPQYHLMNPEQAAYYFTWRAAVRQAVYPRTDYSYLFLYLYEIINLPGRIAPAEGVAAMTALWLAYRRDFPRLDRYIGEWLCDYCLIYSLPAPHEALRPIVGELFDKVSLKEFYVHLSPDAAFPFTPSLCDALTDYDWRASRYVTPENRPLFEEHLYGAVLTLLSSLWQESGGVAELLGLSAVNQTRDAFSGALCSYDAKRRIDLVVLSVSRSYQFRYLLTDACRFAENGIRAHLGIKARMNCPALSEPQRAVLRTYFEEHLPSAAKRQRDAEKQAREARKNDETVPEYAHLYEPAPSSLSATDARTIEEASWVTAERLTAAEEIPVSEPVAAPAPPPAPVPTAGAASDDPYAALVDGLNDDDYAALKCIISGDRAAFEALAAKRLLLPGAAVERLNDMALARTDDVIIDPDRDGSFYHLSEFYACAVTDAVVAREERL